jgi:transcriptional regulator with XRE-family HTH domain
MRLSELKTNGQVLAEDLKRPEYRAEWERTAIARALAIQVLKFRAQRGLSQKALADLLGISQPHISRIEAGVHNPDIETLSRIADVMDARIQVIIPPRRRRPTLQTSAVRRTERRPVAAAARKAASG